METIFDDPVNIEAKRGIVPLLRVNSRERVWYTLNNIGKSRG